MMHKIRRFIRLNKPLVTHSALLIIGILGLFVGLIPSLQKCIVLMRDLRNLNDEIAKVQKKVTILASLDQQVLEQNAQEVIAAVPIGKSMPTFLSTIESVASKNGLSISDMNIEGSTSLASGSGNVQTKPDGNTVSADVIFQGELESIRNFLSECIHVRRFMRIKNMSLSALPRSTLMNVRLSVEVFYLPLPLSIGAPSDPIEPFSQNELATLEKITSYPIVYTFIPQSVSSSQTTVTVEEPTSPSIEDPFALPKQTRTTIPTPTITPIPVELPLQPTTKLTPSATIKPTPKQSPSSSPTVSPTP